MPSYFVTGASRGIGFSLISQLSEDPAATVIGLARDKASTDKKIASELPGRKIHILQGDLQDYSSLKKAAEDTAIITGGSLDILIANAGFWSLWAQFTGVKDLANLPDLLTKELNDTFQINVVGNIHLYNLFMPLILKGQDKKVVTIGTGLADIDITVNYDIESNMAYAISKAAANMAVAKYSAAYRDQGVLFLSVAPGLVDTNDISNVPEIVKGVVDVETAQANMMSTIGKFAAYAPNFWGPITAAESAKLVLDVISKATVEKDAGAYVSQFGNKQWL